MVPAVSVLIKPSSGMCNMRCDYCFYCDETAKRTTASYGFMSEKTLKNVIRRTLLQAEKAASFAFQGGEPTLRGLDFFRKVIEFQKQYNKNGVQITNALQTNGFALDEDWCRFLHDHHFLVGLSVDGTPALHDQYRHTPAGGKTFERIEQTIHLLERFEVDYNILTVVTGTLASHIREVYAYYQSRNWKYQQYIACLDPLEEERGRPLYALLPEEYGRFLIELFDLWYEDLQQGRQPYIRQFENYIGILAGYQPEACDQRGICGIQYVVEADGSVFPCDFYMLDDYCLGNFNQDRLEAIDRKREEIGFVQRSLVLTEECRTCPYFGICRGGCQRHRDLRENDGRYANYFCPAYRMFFAHALDKMKEIAAN